MRVALFALAVIVLAAAFAGVVHSGARSPLATAAVLAIELAAIALAVAFHLLELPRPGAQVRRHPRDYHDADYL